MPADQTSLAALAGASAPDTASDSPPATEPTTETGTPPATSPTETSGPPPEPPSPPPPQTDDPLEIARWFYNTPYARGLRLPEKYRSDADFLQEVGYALKTRGERDETKDTLDRLLAEQAAGDGKIDSWDKFQRLQTSLQNASPEAQTKLMQHAEAIQRAAWEMAHDPEAFAARVRKALGDGVVSREDLEQHEQQQQEQQAIRKWREDNLKLLFNDGDPQKGKTALHQRAEQILENDPMLARIQDPLARADMALRAAKAEHTSTTPPATPSEHAKRQPTHAAGAPPADEVPYDFFKKESEAGRASGMLARFAQRNLPKS